MESGGVYLRLANDGDKAVVAFCGEPHPREEHWTGKEYAPCTASLLQFPDAYKRSLSPSRVGNWVRQTHA